MAGIDKFQGLTRWQGTTGGYFQHTSQYKDFKLNFPPQFLFHTTSGLVVLMGHNCDYTEWSSWTECNAT